ncbi:MAG: hypothetical protein AAF333_10250 [Planctomycetota bacterium]
MAIYFRLSSVPELQHFPRDMRPVVVERCFAHAAQIPASRVAPFFVVPAVFGSFVAGVLSTAVAPVCGLVFVPLLLASAAIVPAMIHSDRDRLRRAIALYGHGYRLPVCARCDYDLRGTESETCPECGAPTRLRAALSSSER